MPKTAKPPDKTAKDEPTMEQLQSRIAALEEAQTRWREDKASIRKLREDADVLKEKLKSKKAQIEEAVKNLVYDSEDSPNLFDGVGSNGQPQAAPEPWRIVPIAELQEHGLPATLTRTLADSQIMNIGQLADYTADGKLLTDLAGVGPAKAEKIEKALEEFWAAQKRREETQPGGEEEE